MGLVIASIFIMVTNTWCVTVDPIGSDWKTPSSRSQRQSQKDSSMESLSVMWPPPPSDKGFRPPSRSPALTSNPSLKTTSRFPSNQRPSGLLEASSPFISRPGLPSSNLPLGSRPSDLLDAGSTSFLTKQRPSFLELSSPKFQSSQSSFGFLEAPSSQFPSFQDDIRNIRSQFGNAVTQTFAIQNSGSDSIKSKPIFNSQYLDTSNRKPQSFVDTSDSLISESILHSQSTPQRDQQLQFQNNAFQSEKFLGPITENPSFIRQTNFVQNVIPIKSNWRDFGGRPSVEDIRTTEVNQVFQTPHIKEHSISTRPHIFSDLRLKDSSVFLNETNYSVEPIVQFSQSIEASEHHSTYNPSIPIFEQQRLPSAIRVTRGPALGAATRTIENQVRTTTPSDSKKKITLKDILAEDCPNAKEIGYCASPPRYPANQIKQIMSRCAEILQSLYAPIPDGDEDDEDSATLASNSSLSIERGNRQVWSWARPGDTQQTVCDSERRRIEPGYVLDPQTGHWYVVVQAKAFHQYVKTDVCRGVGKPCTTTKCSRGSGFRNSSAKLSRCAQRHAYSHLITWDPDKPDLCPRIRVFRFPTACLCYLTST